MNLGPGFLIVLMVFGAVTAMIVRSKGYPWWVVATYGIFGMCLFIIALPAALLMKRNESGVIRAGEAKRCPFCAELIKQQAQVCRFCGRDVLAAA